MFSKGYSALNNCDEYQYEQVNEVAVRMLIQQEIGKHRKRKRKIIKQGLLGASIIKLSIEKTKMSGTSRRKISIFELET